MTFENLRLTHIYSIKVQHIRDASPGGCGATDEHRLECFRIKFLKLPPTPNFTKNIGVCKPELPLSLPSNSLSVLNTSANIAHIP